ncbi:MAG: hypothetical protein KGJ84_13305 [Elusimicrobia bacterium]|nr:hypothetical protein [Elusimicrobiota bacterium]
MSWRRVLLTAAALLAFVYAASYADVVLRARSAYLEGEKWLSWNEHPELKKAHFDAELARTRAGLEADRAAGRLTPAEFDRKLGLATFERDQSVSESSLKYAYVWFQTAAELFTPPESRWTVLSRQKMKTTRELWKKELDAKKIPYQDYMLE